MKLAWFRADAPRPARLLDDTAALIAELRSTHDIEVFTADNAHDFVSTHSRAPYDLSLHELDNTAAHAFIRPFLLHGPGVVLLRTLTFRDSLAAALQAARVTVVADPSTMEALRLEHPGARVRWAIPAVQGVQRVQRVQASPVIFGVLSRGRIEMIQRTIARARDAGAAAVLLDEAIPERVLQDADVIVSLPWPWFGEAQTPALAAMAAGKPVVVLETAATADWPAFDPQTWRPRGSAGETPIAVSIDPRDEEHSLLLAIRRLTTDADLRARLATAAHDWWRTHATPRHAADDWERILTEATNSTKTV
jgi:hypothetical protein